MANFKVTLGGKEYDILNTIPNSQIAAERQIEIAEKAVITPDIETASESDWKDFNKKSRIRDKELIAETIEYLSKLLPELNKKDIQKNSSFKEIIEATYVANCELLDWDYKTPEERQAEREGSNDSEKK